MAVGARWHGDRAQRQALQEAAFEVPASASPASLHAAGRSEAATSRSLPARRRTSWSWPGRGAAGGPRRHAQRGRGARASPSAGAARLEAPRPVEEGRERRVRPLHAGESVEDGMASGLPAIPPQIKADGHGRQGRGDRRRRGRGARRSRRCSSSRRRASRGRRGSRCDEHARYRCDGERALPPAPARDFKRIGDAWRRGPNTGGWAPSPVGGDRHAFRERVRAESTSLGRRTGDAAACRPAGVRTPASCSPQRLRVAEYTVRRRSGDPGAPVAAHRPARRQAPRGAATGGRDG